jgi:hypothetical protein
MTDVRTFDVIVEGGDPAGENAAEVAAYHAIVAAAPIDALRHAVPASPILSEVWLRLLETYRDDYGHEFQ